MNSLKTIAVCAGIFMAHNASAQNVGIGTNTPTEKLHVVGGARIEFLSGVGFRLVQSNATGVLSNIADGTAGQVLTTNGAGALSFQTPGVAASAWELLGNAGTVNGTNFLGTTDAQDLDIRTGNVIRHRFTQQGQIEFLNTGQSVFIGEGAGASDDLSNNDNVFVGYLAGFTTTSGTANIAIGFQTLYNNDTGIYNTAVGARALNTNTTGESNVALGNHALGGNTIGSNNTASGSFALNYNRAGDKATALGALAMYYANNTATSFTNTNVAVGYEALRGSTTPANNTGLNNTALGYQTLVSNSSGSSNTAIGTHALSTNTTGNSNTAIGHEAGDNITTGNQNIMVGYTIDAPVATGSNQMSIGNLIYGTGVDGTGTTVSSGNVGIGVNAPTEKLHVQGGARITSLTGTNSRLVQANATGVLSTILDGNAGQVLTTDGAGALSFQTPGGNNTLDMAYDEGGAGAGRQIDATAGAVRVNGDDGFIVTGTYLSGDLIEVSGAGTRMFFNPNKAAFRAGTVSGTEWDNANIGYFSTAMGRNTIASGSVSTAMGSNTIASGNYSTAMSWNTTASGSYSTAMGSNTIASGSVSTAMGVRTTAPSGYETAIGRYNTGYVPANTTAWNAADRLFVVGNGTGSGALSSNALIIYKNGTMNINDAYDMPTADGTAGQVMTTDGAGVVSFQTIGGNHNTLDMAYDEGGVGAGRIITADAGTVEINGTGGLWVNASTPTISEAILVNNSDGTNSTDTKIGYVGTSGANTYAYGIRSEARLTSATNVFDGGYGVYGLVKHPTNGTVDLNATAASSGNSTNRAVGVFGGVSAQSNYIGGPQDVIAGVYAQTGLHNSGNGSVTGGANLYAGLFAGNGRTLGLWGENSTYIELVPGNQVQDYDAGIIGFYNSDPGGGNNNANIGTGDTYLSIEANVTDATVKHVVLQARTSGDVGIGTATPSEKLHVAGGARITSLSGVNNRLVQSNATGVVSNIADGTAGEVLTTNGAGVISWEPSVAGSWDILGNAGTNPTTNFLGTTDAQDLVLRTNNIENFRINTSGNIDIGASLDDARIYARVLNTDAVTNYGAYIYNDGAAAGETYGTRNLNYTSTNSTKFGLYNNVNSEGTGPHYGIMNYTYMNSAANSTGYGAYNYLSSYGTGNHRASYNYLNHSGTGVSSQNYASYNLMNIATSTNTSTLYGEYTEVDFSAGTSYGEYKEMNSNATYTSSSMYGDYNHMLGTGNGTSYAVYNDFDNTGIGTKYGMRNEFADIGGTKYGTYNYVPNGTGAGVFYGLNNQNYNDGTGNKYGVRNYFATNDGALYGLYNYFTHPPTHNDVMYGNYSYISSNGTGTHYGLYMNVPGGTNDYAAMFVAGNVVANESGGNYDFRVESDLDANMFFVDASTNRVGIGTGTPNCELTVDGWIGRTAHNNGALAGSYNNVGANSAESNPIYVIGTSYKPNQTSLNNMYGIGYAHTNATFVASTQNSWGQYIAADGDARIWFGAGNLGNSYFNTGGNVGVNLVNPLYKMDVYSSSTAVTNVYRGRNGAATGTVTQIGSVEYFQDYASTIDFSGGSNFSLNLNGAAAYDLQLSANSAAKPGSATWTIASDERLKDDINPFKDGLETLRGIEPVYFKYNGKANIKDKNYFVGVVAQDLEKVAPYMVGSWETADGSLPFEQQEASTETYKSVDAGAMTYITINAIKELDAKQTKVKETFKNISDFGVASLNGVETFIPFNDDFKNMLTGTPVVAVTPLNSAASLTIVNQTTQGFTIRINGPFTNTDFNWVAMAKVKEDALDSDNNYSETERMEMLRKVKAENAEINYEREYEEIEIRKIEAAAESARQNETTSDGIDGPKVIEQVKVTYPENLPPVEVDEAPKQDPVKVIPPQEEEPMLEPEEDVSQSKK